MVAPGAPIALRQFRRHLRETASEPLPLSVQRGRCDLARLHGFGERYDIEPVGIDEAPQNFHFRGGEHANVAPSIARRVGARKVMLTGGQLMTVDQDDAVDPAIWDAQPLYADRYYVTTTELLRITFGEGISAGDAARYHTAIVLTRASAAELRDLLTKVLADLDTSGA